MTTIDPTNLEADRRPVTAAGSGINFAGRGRLGCAWRLGAAAVLIGALLLGGVSPGGAEPLRSPVDVAARRAAGPAPARVTSCPVPGPLPHVLTDIVFYTDPPYYSRVDPERARAVYAAMAPIRASLEAIARALTDFVRSAPPGATEAADCVLAHLLRFAADDAMVGSRGWRRSGHLRTLATTPAFAYSVLREAHPVRPDQAAPIEAWLRRVAEAVQAALRDQPYRNNIDLWGAASLAAAAVALQDRTLLDAALTVAFRAVDEITPEGLLPSELARGDAAVQYNLFATQALAVILAVAERNGITTLRERNDGAVLRLMRRMARTVEDPESFVLLTHNAAAVEPKRIYAQNLAWTALRLSATAEEPWNRVACRFQGTFAFQAGGDWQVFFGRPKLCR